MTALTAHYQHAYHQLACFELNIIYMHIVSTSHGQMRPPGPLVALRLIFAAPVPLRDQLVFALHCTSMRTYAGYSTGCGEGGTSSSFPSTPSKSEGHYVGTETKRREKCFTRALGRSRKSGDCKRMWHKEWELEYLEVTTAKMQYSAYRNVRLSVSLIVTNAQTCFFISSQRCQNTVSLDC